MRADVRISAIAGSKLRPIEEERACGRSSSLPLLQPLQHRHKWYAERLRQVRQIIEADGLLATLDLAEELA